MEWKIAGDRAASGMVKEMMLDSGPRSIACAGRLKTKNRSVSEHGGISSTDHGMELGFEYMMLLVTLFDRSLPVISGGVRGVCLNLGSLLAGDGEDVGDLPGDG